MGISQLLKGTPRAVPDKSTQGVMNRKNNKNNGAHLNMKSIFPRRFQDQAPMKFMPEVEDEEESPIGPGLPSASPQPLSNPLEQDYFGLIRLWL
jgi:hypothetical protein